MTLESAIKHCEDVAEEKEKDFSLCPYPSQECNGSQDCRCLKNGSGKGCLKCAKEHRQLAEWLIELKRADTLLKATYDLLNKQLGNYCVLNLIAETVYYDGAECDGNCLMEDINAWMYERGIDHDTTGN